jgi:hypothetical protein
MVILAGGVQRKKASNVIWPLHGVTQEGRKLPDIARSVSSIGDRLLADRQVSVSFCGVVAEFVAMPNFERMMVR